MLNMASNRYDITFRLWFQTEQNHIGPGFGFDSGNDIRIVRSSLTGNDLLNRSKNV